MAYAYCIFLFVVVLRRFLCNLVIACSSLPAVDNPYDYQGRSYLHIPQDLDVNLRSEDPPLKCFIPKKLIHTW